MEFFKKEYPDTGDVAVDVTYVSFGDRLRAIRKEKGMSQDEFAKLLGTSKQVLSRYEIGQIMNSNDLSVKLCMRPGTI